MKTKDLNKKSKIELEKELAEKSVKLRDIRFGVAGGKGKNVKEYGNIKKDIARLKTLIKIKD